MARYVTYQCPECEGRFRYLHHPSDDPPPDRCPLCHAWVSESEPVFVPQAPLIRENAYARSVDQTYNSMMASSIDRAEDAGDMLDAQLRAAGVDDDTRRQQVAEAKSTIKITNLRDPSEMREGDTAAIMPSTEAAAQRLTIGASRPGFQNLAQGIPNMSPGVGPARSGVDAHAAMSGHGGWTDGTPAVPNAQHEQRAAAMFRAGQMGSYREN